MPISKTNKTKANSKTVNTTPLKTVDIAEIVNQYKAEYLPLDSEKLVLNALNTAKVLRDKTSTPLYIPDSIEKVVNFTANKEAPYNQIKPTMITLKQKKHSVDYYALLAEAFNLGYTVNMKAKTTVTNNKSVQLISPNASTDSELLEMMESHYSVETEAHKAAYFESSKVEAYVSKVLHENKEFNKLVETQEARKAITEAIKTEVNK